MKALRDITGKVLDIVILICALLLASSIVIYAINCFLRYGFKAPMPWPEEYCTYFVVFMVYLLQCRLEFKDEELVIGVIDGQLKKSKVLRIVTFWIRTLVTIGIYGYLFTIGQTVIQQQVRFGALTPVMKIPLGIYFNLINICLLLVIVFSVINLITKDYNELPSEEEFE